MNRNGMDPGALNSSLKEYVDRMIRIRYLSSPDLHGVPNAEAYSEVLLENFRNIGGLAQQNRKLISDIIDPILNVPEPLDADTIAPKPGGHFTYAEAEYKSVFGKVVSKWEKADGGYRFDITIPSNCDARIILPDGTSKTVFAGSYSIGL